jgi:hypothetical protein
VLIFPLLHPPFRPCPPPLCAVFWNANKMKAADACQQQRASMNNNECNKEGFFHLCTRHNSDYKWRTSPAIMGCLEVPSEPTLSLQAPYVVRRPAVVVAATADAAVQHNATATATATAAAADFEQALHVWHALQLRHEFVAACAGTAQVHTCCFGLVSNDDATIRQLVPDLNRGWVRATNRRLHRLGHAFGIDCFVWNWQNALGKSETNILLIRFYKVVVPSASFSTLSLSSSITSVGWMESGDDGEHEPSVSGP